MYKKLKFENIINPVFGFLIIAGLILLLGKASWWPSFYNAHFLGTAFLASAGLILLPKYILRTDDQCRRDAVTKLRAAISLALILNALGELYLYELYHYGIQYDKIIHFSTSFTFVIVLTFFAQAWFRMPAKKALLLGVILVISGGFLWELLEYSSDLIFKTKELGIYGQYVVSDTVFDLLSDFFGAFVSAIVLLYSKSARKIFSQYCQRLTGTSEKKQLLSLDKRKNAF